MFVCVNVSSLKFLHFILHTATIKEQGSSRVHLDKAVLVPRTAFVLLRHIYIKHLLAIILCARQNSTNKLVICVTKLVYLQLTSIFFMRC
jgi:hypothetical protein